MKRVILTVFTVVATLLFCGCNCIQETTAKPVSSASKKLKVGLYVDDGASGNGVLHLASLITHSPQTELVLLVAEDIRAGKLKNVDVLVMPGGSSSKQCNTIGKEHWYKIHDFLRNGGCYIGTCAGMFNVLEHRLNLLPFSRHFKAGGSTAFVKVEISPEGAKILGIKPGERVVRYSGGPVAFKVDKSKCEGKGIALATYKSAVSRDKAQEGKFIGSTAWVYGSYGKGKVIATSFHPEYWDNTHDMMLACFYAVSGVKMTPEFPKKNPRPLRVGVFTTGMNKKAAVNAMLELESEPDIDLDYVMAAEINQGILRHLDVLILPNSKINVAKDYITTKQLKDFMDAGNTVVATGKIATLAPEHKNLIKLPAKASVKKHIMNKL